MQLSAELISTDYRATPQREKRLVNTVARSRNLLVKQKGKLNKRQIVSARPRKDGKTIYLYRILMGVIRTHNANYYWPFLKKRFYE
mmetsp:Transcript_22684/g.36444  ORF Transcript_22684/g.36444 Transcript_22684/m.36444 type:complete len:86 (-) Transcript_22684:952-1209(-)